MSNAIILAAGLGQRLAPLTEHIPKCLIDIGGKRLIEFCIDFAESLTGGGHITVVGGAHWQLLEEHHSKSKYRGRYSLTYNDKFSQGSIFSICCGLAASPLPSYILNADHLFSPLSATKFRPLTQTDVQVFCDSSRDLGSDDMKVSVETKHITRVLAMSKRLESWDFGYVGITYIPKINAAAYVAACEEVKRFDPNASAEAGTVEYIKRGNGVVPVVLPDIRWREIDTVEDHQSAYAFTRTL